jgi:uncharacterized membrane protein YqjE
MNEAGAPPQAAPVSGFLSSLSRLLVTVVEMTHTRLELVLVELQEGAEGLVGVVVWSLVATFAAAAGLFIGSLALIFAFWDTHRILVAVLIMVAFLLIALVAGLVVFSRLRARHTLFTASLSEFAKDRALLRAPR